jgi:asparagine synthase (glutamine-hydrolysing)
VIGPAVTGLTVSRENKRGEVIHKAQEFVGGGGISKTADRHFEWACIADDTARAAFKSFNPADNGRNRFRQAHQSAESYLPTERQDDMSRILAVDTRFGLPNQILHKTDRASMYNSLEVRVPFLDTRLIEYAMSLPANYKITRRKQKRILKQAFDDVLPDSILKRRKRGFDMPIGEWFKNELEAEFKDAVTAADTDFIDAKTVFDAFKDHKAGRGQHSKFLWAVYVFARWHRRMEESGVI